MELARLAVLYVHLIACCVAIGLVFTSDLAMIRKLLGNNPAAPEDPSHLRSLTTSVSNALIVLWITGIAIVWVDMQDKGIGYLDNPKLQAKIAIVVLLTINGVLLHNVIFPAMLKAGALVNLSFNRRVLAIFCGALSGVSWFYTAMLGVGRPLAWKYSLVELLAAYPFLVAGGAATMLALSMWAKAGPSVTHEGRGHAMHEDLIEKPAT
jgi:hypothetical protein